ncbi:MULTISPECIES: hypothetical protein [Microbulbifer]|uniref:hypothetical protein n=1 Tax=Microbulbifer TaxID=48073 RepID=UPI001E391C2E|nr:MULTISPECIES: hypothetical protein [Microbulbifer]UHQ56822.1 hypothetical protein LVE68_07570 [Microbulbifer sp. YPW16]
MSKLSKLAAILVAGGVAMPLAAQPVAEVGAVYQGSWGFHGETISLDADAAALNGIADSGFGIGASYAGRKGMFNFSVGGSIFFIDDEDEFSQDVENIVTGDQRTQDSSIDAGSLYIDGGLVHSFSDRFEAGVNVGYRYFDIDRTITSCTDCYSEDISIESDSYIKPFARFLFTDRVLGSLAYYSYNGDKGVESTLQFSAEVRM